MIDNKTHLVSWEPGAWITPLRVRTFRGRVLTPAHLTADPEAVTCPTCRKEAEMIARRREMLGPLERALLGRPS